MIDFQSLKIVGSTRNSKTPRSAKGRIPTHVFTHLVDSSRKGSKVAHAGTSVFVGMEADTLKYGDADLGLVTRRANSCLTLQW